MACSISISDDADGFWMLNNRSAWVFYDDIVVPFYCEGDLDVINHVAKMSDTQLSSLHLDFEKNPERTRRVARALRSAATDIANETIHLEDFYEFKSEDEKVFFKRRFRELADLISRWESRVNNYN